MLFSDLYLFLDYFTDLYASFISAVFLDGINYSNYFIWYFHWSFIWISSYLNIFN